MPYSFQFGDFVVNLIAYLILIEPHPVYNFIDLTICYFGNINAHSFNHTFLFCRIYQIHHYVTYPRHDCEIKNKAVGTR